MRTYGRAEENDPVVLSRGSSICWDYLDSEPVPRISTDWWVLATNSASGVETLDAPKRRPGRSSKRCTRTALASRAADLPYRHVVIIIVITPPDRQGLHGTPRHGAHARDGDRNLLVVDAMQLSPALGLGLIPLDAVASGGICPGRCSWRRGQR
jgi:hypothetical protein